MKITNIAEARTEFNRTLALTNVSKKRLQTYIADNKTFAIVMKNRRCPEAALTAELRAQAATEYMQLAGKHTNKKG